jgi:bla regulator protein BlaR1
MNANLEWENGLRWLAIHSWQAGMLVLLVLAVQLVLRRRLTNRWRFALWWIVLARLLLPINPASTVSLFNFLSPRVQMENPMVARATPPPREVSVKSADSNPVSSVMPPAPAVAGEAASSPDLSARQRTILPVRPSSKSVAPVTYENYLMPGLAGMWVAGVLLLTGVIAFQVLHFGRKLARTASSSDPRLQRLLDDCRREFGLARPVELRETGAVESPVLFGLRRPQLLLPRGIGDQFSDRELRYIFLHELAHVKRGDLWLNWVVAALQTVHWFNPLLWVGFARLRADRELACDELALLYAGDRAGTAYGETVVKFYWNI